MTPATRDLDADRSPRSTLARDMLRDPSVTPSERAWWQAVVDMADARLLGASERELERMARECDRLSEIARQAVRLR